MLKILAALIYCTNVICLLAVIGVRKDRLDWCDKYHPYITLSPPLSLFPSVRVCWRVQDSQRFMSVTLSNSDISLTTPRTGIRTHAHTPPSFHTHIVFVCPALPFPPLCSAAHKHVSGGIRNRRRAKHCTESIPANMAEALEPLRS